MCTAFALAPRACPRPTLTPCRRSLEPPYARALLCSTPRPWAALRPCVPSKLRAACQCCSAPPSSCSSPGCMTLLFVRLLRWGELRRWQATYDGSTETELEPILRFGRQQALGRRSAREPLQDELWPSRSLDGVGQPLQLLTNVIILRRGADWLAQQSVRRQGVRTGHVLRATEGRGQDLASRGP